MAIILSQITVGDHRIMIVDSVPNTGAGITAPIGSMIVVEGQDAVWLKTGSLDTDWKISTVDKAALDLQISGIEGDIAQEILDRGAADTTLQGNIDAEESRALAAEGVIQGNVDAVASDLAQEVLDRQAAVQGVQNQLDALDTNYATDAQVTAAVQAEANARILQDGILQGNIDTVASNLAQEIIDRGAADFAEAQTRIAEDGILQDNINAEVSRALIAEGVLQGNIDAEQSARIAEDLTFLKLDGSRAMTNPLNMGGHKVEFVHSPENASDAATKQYVDDLLAGLSWKEAVHSATVELENINLANPGTATIGGHLLVQGQRVLIKDQTDSKENGIYIFDSSSTALVRSSDANSWSELEGAVVYVQEGTNAGGKFVATIPPTGVIGVDPITFTMFSAANALDGVGTADTVAVWTDVHTLGSSLVTTQELEYVSGVTSGIQGQIDAEESARIAADNALDGRLDIIEGIGEGSVAKAEQDAKDYADAAVLVETNARIAADNALDLRLDALELDPVTKSYVDAADSVLDLRLDALELDPVTKTYVDAADSALDLRLDTLELDPVTKTYVDLADADLEATIGVVIGGAGLEVGGAYNPPVGSNYLDLATSLKDADSKLDTAIKAEETRAIAAENALDSRIATLELDPVTKTYVDAQDQSILSTAAVYTDDAIAALVDAAPALLDTLNELAAALGDDPNFAATVATQIGNIQSELDATQAGAGLTVAGAYVPNAGANYIFDAESLKDADDVLDGALYAEEQARIAEDALKLNKAGDTMSGDLNMGSNDIVSVASIGINTATPETILHLEESTVKFTTRMVSSQTVGAVNSVMASVTPSSNSVELLKIKVIGVDIATHDSVAYERTVRVKNIGGVVSLGTVQSDYTSEDPGLASANCTFVQNGSNIDIRVTGVNAKTLTWKAVVERVR